MTDKSVLSGHIACFTAYAIFGFNIIFCKDLANSHIISPLGLFSIRSLVAAALFWIVSLFMSREKVDRADLAKIFAASLLGLYIPQLTFLKAITVTTPMDLSILSALTPIFTMFVAAITLKEPITWKKAGGVFISFAGVIFLIYNSVNLSTGAQQTKPLGVVLIILNSFSFALYLGIFKPLIAKYNVVTFMKWMFLFSMLVSLPFKLNELVAVDYASFPSNSLFDIAFLVIMATFVAYFLIPVGQKHLRPTVLSMYSYIQPIIASVVSVCVGMDIIGWQKIVAATAVFAGVILVNKSRAASQNHVHVEKRFE